MSKPKATAKDVISRAKERPNKVKTSLTFDEEVFNRFQAACEKNGAPMSRVLEELMKKFLDEL